MAHYLHIPYLMIPILAIAMYSSSGHGQVQMDAHTLKPCDHITVTSSEKIKLTNVEVNLICGDPDNPGWKHIPPTQATYLLRTFLEDRGYWDAKISAKGETITAITGRIKTLKSLEVVNSPIDIDVERYWYPRGKPLTPSLLNTIEDWVKSVLAQNGYPCATVQTTASQINGKVRVEVNSGEIWTIKEIISAGIPDKLGGIERRYDAFKMDQTLDAQKLELTSQRLLANDLVASSSFTPLCEKPEDRGKIKHSLVAGAPRLLSFGFGFDTEEYAIVRALWKNGRMFASGSPIDVQVWASYVRQETVAQWNWYYLPFPAKHFLNLFAQTKRLNEKRYEQRSTKFSLAPSWHRDLGAVRWQISTGPAYEYIYTPRGLSKQDIRLLTWETRFGFNTHDYEYYAVNPRNGHRFDLMHAYASTDFVSNVSADLWQINTTHLWNVAALDPPIFILGLRTALATTLAGEDTVEEDLPASFRHHLGGANNLRGFGRNALPNDDLGALSSAYMGTELRLNNIIAYGLQPLVFTDTAILGADAYSLDTNTRYYSPGLGMRWESPIGSMRFTFSHGIIGGEKKEELDHLSRWQFYFNFGEQF